MAKICKKPAAKVKDKGEPHKGEPHKEEKKDYHKDKRDRHLVKSRTRSSGKHKRGSRSGSWAETEVMFHMVVANKDAEIQAKDAEIKELKRQISYEQQTVMASRCVSRGWYEKWRALAGVGAPSDSGSESSSWEP
jgi:hypothetical protein